LVLWEFDKEPYCERKRIGDQGYEVIRVTAAPGYGKSALLRYLQEIVKPGSKIGGTRPHEIRNLLPKGEESFYNRHVITIKLDELGSKFGIRSTMLDELKNEDGFPRPPFGTLRAFDYDDHAAPGVEFLMRQFNSAQEVTNVVLIIDSIDELHPSSAKSLLKRIDDYIKERKREDEYLEDGKKRFLRILVLGRPEGFTEYYRVPQGGVPKTQPVKLREPCFQSHDDLFFAATSVVKFNMLGDRDDPWARDEPEINRMSHNAIEFAKQHPWLRESVYNLSSFGDLIRFSDVYTHGATPPASLQDEFQLREIFFESLLARARDVHNRPIARSQEYLYLLEEIACKFARCHQIDNRDHFMVTPNDFVEIDVMVDKHRQTSSYLAEAVLNRSGLVDLDSLDRFPRYRFYPHWVRDHLLERHRRRLQALAKQGNMMDICSRHCVRPGCHH
jgi:hypothetical protein